MSKETKKGQDDNDSMIEDIMAAAAGVGQQDDAKPAIPEKHEKASISNLYLLGGAGIKICNTVEVTDEFNPYYIDTSSSEDTMIPAGVKKILIKPISEGSGGVRATNYDLLKSSIPDIVDTTNPTPINYVVFSASGATGSVSAYILLEELLERGLSVVVVMSVKADNPTRRRNTLNTIQSLHNLVVEKDRSIPVFLNTVEDIPEQDRLSRRFLKIAYELLADNQIGIDDSDRANFLSPNHAVDIKPTVSSIVARFSESKETNPVLDNIVSSLVINDASNPVEDAEDEALIGYNGYFNATSKERLSTIINQDVNVAGLYTLKLPVYVYMGSLLSKVQEDKSHKVQMENENASLTNLSGKGIQL